MSALQEAPTEGLLQIPGCEFTPTQLILPPNLSYDQWDRIGRQLQLADIAVQWWIGDWLLYGEHKWGDKYTQAIQVTGRAEQTLINYQNVARSIESNRRRLELGFSIHAEVASLPEEDQERILAKAAKEPNPTVRGVRREADKAKRAKQPKPVDTEIVLSKQAREFLDEYMTELAEWSNRLPLGVSTSERQALEKMIYEQGNDALWLKNRTVGADYKAIVELFSFDEGTPGMERAGRADISTWLEKCGYYMSESDLDARLDLMVEKHMLDLHSVEESRQDGRRGVMLSLYALNPDYEATLESRK